MGIVFFVRFFGWFRSHRLWRGTRAALLPGIVSQRTMASGIAGGSDRFWSRDGEVIHTFLHSCRVTDSNRSMIVIVTTCK